MLINPCLLTDDIGIPNGRSYQRSTSVDGKLYWKNKQRKRQSEYSYVLSG